MTSDETTQREEPAPDQTGWRLWPPSPKVQIVLIAAAFGLFNLLLVAIWAIVMMTQSS